MRVLMLRAAIAALTLITGITEAAFARQPAQVELRGVLVGRVLEMNTEVPIAGALVELAGTERRVRTDSLGVFRLPNLPRGVNFVVVRAIGFDSLQSRVRVFGGDSISADYYVARYVNRLANVRVEASLLDLKLSEFNERRALGLGTYLDGEYFDKHQGRHVGGLIQARVPGLRRKIYPDGTESLVVTRGPGTCKPQFIVNGFLAPDFDVGSTPASDILGFEYYTVATTPLKYNVTGPKTGGAWCGTAIFWTK